MAGAGYKLFQTGDVLTAAQVNTYLNEQTVMVFADATARTAALSGVLAEGMVSYLKDTNAVEKYDGSAWVALVAGDIESVTASSPLTGGGSSGAVTIGIQDGTTAQKGAVQLEDSTSSTSTTKAATPNSVKSAYDLANAAIPKSLADAAGDIFYATADNTVTRLGIGTAGQVLKVNSGATAPEWGAASGGSSFVGVSAYKSSNQTVNNATDTAITWTAEDFDTDGFHDNSTNTSRFTIPSGKGGYYLINCLITPDIYTINRFLATIKKNNTTSLIQFEVSSTNSSAGPTGSGIVNLAAGDYIEVIVYHNQGGAINVVGATFYSKFSMQYLGA